MHIFLQKKGIKMRKATVRIWRTCDTCHAKLMAKVIKVYKKDGFKLIGDSIDEPLENSLFKSSTCKHLDGYNYPETITILKFEK